MSMPPPQMETQSEYVARFADVDYWRPYVQEVCKRHSLFPRDAIRCKNPGTYPTFIVNNTWVVKFFGQRFNGLAAHDAEVEANHLLQDSTIPIATLLIEGDLYPHKDEWRWPYLVFNYLEGRSLGEIRSAMQPNDLHRLAAELGSLVRTLHEIDLRDTKVLRLAWDAYLAMLATFEADCIDRQRTWAALPDHLRQHIPDYLAAHPLHIDMGKRPVLIHADITVDHVLLQKDDLGWRITGLIDWGDALVGDPTYELLALHIDAFNCDKALLSEFLREYRGFDKQHAQLPTFLMYLTLISQYPLMKIVCERFPHAKGLATLEELANALFDEDSPNL
jgi:hygromycin-B 7''-O-kinase